MLPARSPKGAGTHMLPICASWQRARQACQSAPIARPPQCLAQAAYTPAPRFLCVPSLKQPVEAVRQIDAAGAGFVATPRGLRRVHDTRARSSGRSHPPFVDDSDLGAIDLVSDVEAFEGGSGRPLSRRPVLPTTLACWWICQRNHRLCQDAGDGKTGLPEGSGDRAEILVRPLPELDCRQTGVAGRQCLQKAMRIQ
ncbi:hypothetical protein EV130_1155 [Rhizobium azibense]|uniref:Uncharacterized protein n=1 Tax=Rhizobium azibense TaxID=1136135 RepID=A0A4R3Q8V9_9HYPH|nr:hypothetical protein EV130_1155 [Rhizobium azibense]